MESLVYSRERIIPVHVVKECGLHSAYHSLDTAFLITACGITKAYLHAIVTHKVHEAGIVLYLWPAFYYHCLKVIVAEAAGCAIHGRQCHDVSLYEELKGGAGEYMGKEVAGITQNEHKTK